MPTRQRFENRAPLPFALGLSLSCVFRWRVRSFWTTDKTIDGREARAKVSRRKCSTNESFIAAADRQRHLTKICCRRLKDTLALELSLQLGSLTCSGGGNKSATLMTGRRPEISRWPTFRAAGMKKRPACRVSRLECHVLQMCARIPSEAASTLGCGRHASTRMFVVFALGGSSRSGYGVMFTLLLDAKATRHSPIDYRAYFLFVRNYSTL